MIPGREAEGGGWGGAAITYNTKSKLEETRTIKSSVPRYILLIVVQNDACRKRWKIYS